MQLSDINTLPVESVREELTRCCGSSTWVKTMLANRPFSSEAQLYHKAEKIWNDCQPADWLEAFGHHPRIGEKNLKEKFGSTQQWASQEQKGVAVATEQILNDLIALNRQYEKQFGYIFIVCATGKSAGEMLELLEARMKNKADVELKIAMAEQNKITKLRLQKLLS